MRFQQNREGSYVRTGTYVFNSPLQHDQSAHIYGVSSFTCHVCNDDKVAGLVRRYCAEMNMSDALDFVVLVGFDEEMSKLTNVPTAAMSKLKAGGQEGPPNMALPQCLADIVGEDLHILSQAWRTFTF